MEIDIYQTCPCHSEKKIKFCCGKSIVSDLNRIVELNKSRQAVAALEHVDRAISKMGPCDCLLTLKTHVLINLREFEAAESVNQEFLARNPRSPLGHQHRALLLASHGKTSQAVQALQDAMDLLPDQDIPVSMASAFRVVGMLLFSYGHLVAGREHLVFANDLCEEPAIAPMISQTWRSPDVPLVMKRSLQVSMLPEDPEKPWRESTRNAVRFAQRGRWRAARQRMQLLDDQFPEQPEILDAIARLSLALGDEPTAVDAWRRRSRLPDMTPDERAELLALVFTIGDEPLTPSIDIVRVTFPLTDQSRLLEQIATQPRLIHGAMMAVHYHEEGPPPAAAGMLLDRDEVTMTESGDSIADEFPAIVAEFLIYGKRTDREGRVELFVVNDTNGPDTVAWFSRTLADCIGSESERVVVDQTSELENLMDSRWHLPQAMSSAQRREFMNRKREHKFLELWPNLPMLPLSGQSPHAAVQRGDETTRGMVAALVLLLEQGADATWWNTFDFDRLRDQLGLPHRAPLSGSREGVLKDSPLSLQRLDFANLGDEDLISCFVVGSMTGNYRMLRKCLPCILARPQLDAEAPFEQVCSLLAKISPDNDAAMELMQQARQHAIAHDRSVGPMLVMELDLRLQRDMADGAQELLGIIESRFMQDAQVQYQLATVLQKYGLLRGDPMRGGAETAAEPVGVAADESELWTPGSAGAKSPAETRPSKLWLPE